MIVTSILPTDVGGEYNKQRITYLNSKIKDEVEREGGKFIDLDRHFITDNRINKELYKTESCGLLHINEKGARVVIRTINSELKKMGLNEIIEDFRRDTHPYRRR